MTEKNVNQDYQHSELQLIGFSLALLFLFLSRMLSLKTGLLDNS